MSPTLKQAVLSLGTLLLLGMSGCTAPRPASPSPSPTVVDKLPQLLATARHAKASANREAEALALRDAVEIAATRPDRAQLEKIRNGCVEAMVEAGDNANSYRIWTDLAKKNPGSAKEAKRMVERARRQLLTQAGELVEQVSVDLAANRRQAALCTAMAARKLYILANADAKEKKTAAALVKKVETLIATPPVPDEAPEKSNR